MKKVFLLTAVLVMSGCATQSFTINGNNGGSPKTDDMQSFFVSGIGQKKNVDAATVCGGADRVAKVEVEQTGLDCLLAVVTGGIYTPRNARVYCTK